MVDFFTRQSEAQTPRVLLLTYNINGIDCEEAGIGGFGGVNVGTTSTYARARAKKRKKINMALFHKTGKVLQNSGTEIQEGKKRLSRV